MVEPRLANLAVKADLADVTAWLERTPGTAIVGRHEVAGETFIEARIGDTLVNFFAAALYERADAPLPPGLLHTSYWISQLDEALAHPEWADSLLWGPEEISGGFGHRRIAFFEPQPGLRIELMEDLVGS